MKNRVINFIEKHQGILAISIAIIGSVLLGLAFHSQPTKDQRYKEYYLKGVEAQQNNIPPDACPYSMGDTFGGDTFPRMYWMFGWTDSKLNKVKQ